MRKNCSARLVIDPLEASKMTSVFDFCVLVYRRQLVIVLFVRRSLCCQLKLICGELFWAIRSTNNFFSFFLFICFRCRVYLERCDRTRISDSFVLFFLLVQFFSLTWIAYGQMAMTFQYAIMLSPADVEPHMVVQTKRHDFFAGKETKFMVRIDRFRQLFSCGLDDCRLVDDSTSSSSATFNRFAFEYACDACSLHISSDWRWIRIFFSCLSLVSSKARAKNKTMKIVMRWTHLPLLRLTLYVRFSNVMLSGCKRTSILFSMRFYFCRLIYNWILPVRFFVSNLYGDKRRKKREKKN